MIDYDEFSKRLVDASTDADLLIIQISLIDDELRIYAKSKLTPPTFVFELRFDPVFASRASTETLYNIFMKSVSKAILEAVYENSEIVWELESESEPFDIVMLELSPVKAPPTQERLLAN